MDYKTKRLAATHVGRRVVAVASALAMASSSVPAVGMLASVAPQVALAETVTGGTGAYTVSFDKDVLGDDTAFTIQLTYVKPAVTSDANDDGTDDTLDEAPIAIIETVGYDSTEKKVVSNYQIDDTQTFDTNAATTNVNAVTAAAAASEVKSLETEYKTVLNTAANLASVQVTYGGSKLKGVKVGGKTFAVATLLGKNYATTGAADDSAATQLAGISSRTSTATATSRSDTRGPANSWPPASWTCSASSTPITT